MRRCVPSLVVLAVAGSMLAAALVEAQTGSQTPASHAQPLRVVAEQDATLAPDNDAKLAFDALGRLHAIGSKRAITYTATSPVEAKVTALDPGSGILSISADGRKAVIAVSDGKDAHLFLFDTLTGERQSVPTSWYVPGADASDFDVDLSGDGRLLSIYSEASDTDAAMIVRVYDWRTKTLVAKRTSDYIAAGGGFGGGVTADGAVEFDNNRVGYEVVNLKTGAAMGEFGPDSVRSPDGRWEIELPDQSWIETNPKDALVKSGSNGKTIGRLAAHFSENDIYGRVIGVFCGNSGRFVAAGELGLAMYAIPTGALLASFPYSSWRNTKADDKIPSALACSANGTRVAVLDGTRLTLHDIQ